MASALPNSASFWRRIGGEHGHYRVASTTADVGGAWLLIASCNFVMYFSERTGLRIVDSVTGYVTPFDARGTAIPACHAILRLWSGLDDAGVQ
jgi:hypothetical protein